jgi:hypothetical protein
MEKHHLNVREGDFVSFRQYRGLEHLACMVGVIQCVSYPYGEPWLHILVPALKSLDSDGMVGIDPTGVLYVGN